MSIQLPLSDIYNEKVFKLLAMKQGEKQSALVYFWESLAYRVKKKPRSGLYILSKLTTTIFSYTFSVAFMEKL